MVENKRQFWHFLWQKRVLLLTLLIAVLYLLAVNEVLYTWGDNAHYIIVGKSLATGQGFKDIHYPGSPPFTYPIPLFPILLAPFIYVFGYSLVPLKIVVAFTGVVAVYLVYRLFREELGDALAILLMLLVGVSPQIVSFSHQVMSEIPYLAFSLLAFLFVRRYAGEGKWWTPVGLLAAAALAAAFLTRTIGITLILASVFYLLWETPAGKVQNLKKAGFLAAVTAVLWLLFNAPILAEMPYIREFLQESPYTTGTERAGTTELIQRVGKNLNAYGVTIPETILYATYHKPSFIAGAFSFLMLGWGFLYSLLKKRTAITYYVLFYFGILLLYEPSNYGNIRRYLVPLIPFILYYFVQGMRQAGRWIGRLRGGQEGRAVAGPGYGTRLPVLVVCALLVLLNLTAVMQASVFQSRAEMFDYYTFDDWEGFREMALWTRENVPDESVVVSRMIYFYHFWSQKTVDWYPFVEPQGGQEGILQTIFAMDADYIAVDSLTIDRTAAQDAVVQTVAQNPALFTAVYEGGDNRVYRIDTGAWLAREERPLVTQEIRYQLAGATEVFLVWGINGWLVVPPEQRPPGTAVRDLIMYTPMARDGDDFVAKIAVPLGTTIDYAFQITGTRNGGDIEIWDTNGAPQKDYRTVASDGGVARIEAALSLVQE